MDLERRREIAARIVDRPPLMWREMRDRARSITRIDWEYVAKISESFPPIIIRDTHDEWRELNASKDI